MRISAATRISFGLSSLTLSVLFGAQTLGLIPNSEQAVLDGRKALCETVAVECCLAAQRNDLATMRLVTQALVSRNDDIVSAAVRRPNGKLLVEVGEHEASWQFSEGGESRPAQVEVPILQGKQRWGTVEICFRPPTTGMVAAWFMNSNLRLILFVACVGFLGYSWYLKRVLQHLDPSSVVPDRVRDALDTLAEGVLVLDKDQRIVLANKAFARHTGRTTEDLQGAKAPEIHWSNAGGDGATVYPWARALQEGVSQTGVLMGLESAADGRRTFVVNTAPILGGKGERRGALATFDDVTSIEEKNLRLEEMLHSLKESRDEIHRQNEELQLLATRHSLTGCLNRRAFFSRFETHWTAAKGRGAPLGAIMLDIDHFKSINDNHGHSMGDVVLQQVAALLKSIVGDRGLVCRYGGEEFCALLPNFKLEEAAELAEQVRAQLAGQKIAELDITASLGVTAIGHGAKDPRELLEEADKALYYSKRTGRNRITRFSDVPADFSMRAGDAKHAATEPVDTDVPIPFHAVTALISALAYRDTLTAEHSRRVADLCVLTARGLMPERECYVLEVAALLHDIGKLGVPDAILLKPGPLTEEEWKVMSTHDRIGVEIIRAAFSSPDLTEVVRTHHARYAGQAREPGLPSGEDIPLMARILTIADAYDAMVSDRVYRKGRSREDAFTELRRCAGKQFDPGMVERFIESVSSSDQSRVSAAFSVPKQTALRIGLQIERLAGALDVRDFPNLSAMAGRLAATATKEGVPQIAELAGDLEKAAATDPELVNVVRLTTDLLEMCRATQNSYLEMGLEEEAV